MASELKLAVLPFAAGPWRTVYECPVGKSAIVKSCIAANTGEAIATMPATLGIKRGSVITPFTGAIDITSTSSVNLLAGTVTLQAGDKLVTYTPHQSAVSKQLGIFPPALGVVVNMRARGTTLIAVTASGLWRTTDLITWTQVWAAAMSGELLLNIGTTWFCYTSATVAVKSTDDGLTWASQAVTNAPTGYVINSFNAGDIKVGHSGRYAGLTYTSQYVLTTSTDGITWTLATATPQLINPSIAWTGTHYVAGRSSTSADIYRSTDGVAWATVAAVSGLGTGVYSVASDSAGGVVATSTSVGTALVSVNHGATWTTTAADTAAGAPVIYTGSAFLGRASTGYWSSPSGLVGTWTFSRQVLTNNEKYCTYSSVLLNTISGGLQVSTDLAMTLSGAGLSATASLMEVSA